MKKIFTLLAVCMVAVAANAAISIYVNSTTTPYIWSWDASDGVDYNVGAWPGTNAFTEKITHESGIEFWKYTFPESVTSISFLINNGDPDNVQKTADVKGVKGDRYFTWDGATELVDITSDITGEEIPDPVVSSMVLRGNHNGWSGGEAFTEVEAGKTYTLAIDMTELAASVEEGIWKFKPVAITDGGDAWIGFSGIFGDGGTMDGQAPAWLKQAMSDDNFEVDLEAVTDKHFTFTLSWGGGKDAEHNWTMQAANGASGIATVKVLNASTAAIYNLQGQRVDSNYRGIAIQNGKKMLVK